MKVYKSPNISRGTLGLACFVFLLTTLFWGCPITTEAKPGHSRTVVKEQALFTQNSDCSIVQITVGEAVEHRFICTGHHFMTLIDENGTFNFRPHPGCDINGWGSSWYFQPFLPGAVFKHTTIDTVEAQPDGIHVVGSGQVSRGATGTYGTWEATLDFQYSAVEKIVTGTGVYSITLAGPLSNATGDLNLYRIASNYLDDVPLLTNQNGDTGDMSVAAIKGENINLTWIPPNQPSHFPTDKTNWLSIDVKGQYNNVDTGAMGYAPIAPAFKPSLKVVFTAQDPNVDMTFGGIYAQADSQKFWVDNVGITPLIPKTSAETEFEFDVAFESKALERCVYLPLIMVNP